MSTRYDGVKDLADLFDRHWRGVMEDHPETATYVGWHEHHDRFTDLSLDAIERRRREVREPLDALVRVDRRADPLSADLFESLVQSEVDASAFPAELLPLDQLEGPQNDVPFLLSAMAVETDEQRGDYLARLRAIPTVLEQTRALMERGLRTGYSVPAICLRDVPEQFEAHFPTDLAESPELVPLAGAPQPVRDEAAAIVREHVQPALRALQQFVTNTYIPACRDTIALADLPDGAAWYAERVRHHTTTDLTPQEIHDIGRAEVTRITAGMRDVMSETGFAGSVAEFATFLQTDPRFYFDTADDLLAFYRGVNERVQPAIPSMFRLTPRTPLEIVAVPPEQAPSAPAAFYLQGSSGLNRPGRFFANTYDLPSRPSWQMEATCLHEAVPGHHFQLSLAQEMDGMPEFRKNPLGCTAYIEGWGLYCESLGTELGMYTDPYQRYGMLEAELLRAIRLVTDTGMHALGWSRDQAIAFFVDHSPMPKHDVVVEVDRYIVLPGQALAYKIGQLKLQELRTRTASHDIRDFHEEVLRHGALPLDVLERLVEERFAA